MKNFEHEFLHLRQELVSIYEVQQQILNELQRNKRKPSFTEERHFTVPVSICFNAVMLKS